MALKTHSDIILPMPPYSAPKLGVHKMVRYIRLGRAVFVGENNIDSFQDIVRKDHLEQAIAALSAEKAHETDAGWVSIFESGAISVFGSREELDIRITTTGREKTKQDFAQQSPEYHVVGFRR